MTTLESSLFAGEARGGLQPGHAAAANRSLEWDAGCVNCPDLCSGVHAEDHGALAFHGELFGAEFEHEHDRKAAAVLDGLERGGPGALAALNGSFAGLWLRREPNEVILFTDRFGSIPLFYTRANGGVAFATRLSALADAYAPLNPAAVACFPVLQRVLGDATLLEGVSMLTPGTYLRIADGTLSQHAYFERRFTPEERPFEDWAEELTETWRTAVTARCRGKVFLFMSGGLDSRAVLAAAPEPIDCHLFADYENLEVRTARSVCAQRGATCNVIIRDPDYYARGIGDLAEIGSSMYSHVHGHPYAGMDGLSANYDAALHGHPPELYFRGSSMPPGVDESKRGPDAFKRPQFVEAFLRSGKYCGFTHFDKRLLHPPHRDALRGYIADALEPMYDEAAVLTDNPFDQYMWPDTFRISRYPSYLFELAIAAKMTKRSTIWDNALLSLYLRMPPGVRTGDALWLAMCQRLLPGLGALASGNKRPGWFMRLPKPARLAVAGFVTRAGRAGLLPPSYPSNPAHTLGSWPNFDELIRESAPLRNTLRATLATPGALPPAIFDPAAALQLLDDHLAWKRHAADQLLPLLTLATWHARLRGIPLHGAGEPGT